MCLFFPVQIIFFFFSPKFICSLCFLEGKVFTTWLRHLRKYDWEILYIPPSPRLLSQLVNVQYILCIYCRITLNTCLKNVVLESRFPSPCLGKYVRKQHCMKPLNQFLTTIRPYSTFNPASSYTSYFLSQLGFSLFYEKGVGGEGGGRLVKSRAFVDDEDGLLNLWWTKNRTFSTRSFSWLNLLENPSHDFNRPWAVLWKLRPGKSESFKWIILTQFINTVNTTDKRKNMKIFDF